MLPSDVLGASNKHYQQVIVIFFDAFGWSSFERTRRQSSLLNQFEEEGTVSCVTSMFPSTTTAHVTTFHTGLIPAASGLYEWYAYEPLVGEVIVPLPYTTVRTEEPSSLLERGFDPLKVFPFNDRYSAWQKFGHSCFHFAPAAFTPSPYSNAVMRGAKFQPYKSVDSGLDNLTNMLQSNEETGLFHFYFGDYDHICHDDGPESETAFATATNFLSALHERVVKPLRSESTHNRLMIMIADHGQIQMDCGAYIDLDMVCPNLDSMMLSDAKGRALLPGGSGRDVFLHVKPEKVETAVKLLRDSLGSSAEVYPLHELIKNGLFGPNPPNARFLDRAGSVVILPTGPYSIWPLRSSIYGNNNFLGHHGGLTPAEMDSIFMVLEI